MTQKKPTLGRGLADLLGQARPHPPSSASAPLPGADQLARLPVELLQRGRYQPRTDVRSDTLSELADSIRQQGVIQPIVVRPVAGVGAEQRYEIIAGERRWRELDMGHARALLGLENHRKQTELALLVVKKGLSVRETEALVRRLNQPAGTPVRDDGTGSTGRDPNVVRLEGELADKLGAQVQIQHTRSGRGKLVVAYHSLDELDGILSHIQ
jgi:ParB-like chromosome segregation protein Spo0J